MSTTAELLNNIRVVLSHTVHPGNIGAAARAMKTMGLTHLDLVNPQRYPDPESQWRAARAQDVLSAAQVHDTLDNALRDVALAVACTARTRDIAVPGVSAREAASRVVEVARTQPVALVFGNETFGLTSAEVNKCGLIATIPADPAYPALNLAAAVQVFAYEIRLEACGAQLDARPRQLATHEEVERFYDHLEKMMEQTGFLNPQHPKKLMPRLRRLFGRAALETEEVNILRGILKALSREE